MITSDLCVPISDSVLAQVYMQVVLGVNAGLSMWKQTQKKKKLDQGLESVELGSKACRGEGLTGKHFDGLAAHCNFNSVV